MVEGRLENLGRDCGAESKDSLDFEATFSPLGGGGAQLGRQTRFCSVQNRVGCTFFETKIDLQRADKCCFFTDPRLHDGARFEVR